MTTLCHSIGPYTWKFNTYVEPFLELPLLFRQHREARTECLDMTAELSLPITWSRWPDWLRSSFRLLDQAPPGF